MNKVSCPAHAGRVLVSSRVWSDGSTTFTFAREGVDYAGIERRWECTHTVKSGRISAIR